MMKITYLKFYLYIFTFINLIIWGLGDFIEPLVFILEYFSLAFIFTTVCSWHAAYYAGKNLKALNTPFIISSLISMTIVIICTSFIKELNHADFQINQSELKIKSGILKNHDNYSFSYLANGIAIPREHGRFRGRSISSRYPYIDILDEDDNTRFMMYCSITRRDQCIRDINNYLDVESLNNIPATVKIMTISYQGHPRHLLFDLYINPNKHLDSDFFSDLHRKEIAQSIKVCFILISIYLFNIFFCFIFILKNKRNK